MLGKDSTSNVDPAGGGRRRFLLGAAGLATRPPGVSRGLS